jgi:hypothetical protein
MAGMAVAGAGDVIATPSSKPIEGATGAWTAGPVTTTSHSRLRAGGTPVAFQATCTFQFSGTSGSTPVTAAETVTLTATRAAKLQRGGNGVLLDGDTATGPLGNRLAASSARRLRAS